MSLSGRTDDLRCAIQARRGLTLPSYNARRRNERGRRQQHGKLCGVIAVSWHVCAQAQTERVRHWQRWLVCAVVSGCLQYKLAEHYAERWLKRYTSCRAFRECSSEAIRCISSKTRAYAASALKKRWLGQGCWCLTGDLEEDHIIANWSGGTWTARRGRQRSIGGGCSAWWRAEVRSIWRRACDKQGDLSARPIKYLIDNGKTRLIVVRSRRWTRNINLTLW